MSSSLDINLYTNPQVQPLPKIDDTLARNRRLFQTLETGTCCLSQKPWHT